ncbi:MAG: sarcosine oxidase, partial [Planctomycetota bacterium]
MRSYDCIVVGVGAVGSATLSQLAARGARVLGIDRFRPGHNRGSSHGRTRAIRLAYFEHPDYVPLLRRAFELWRGLNDRASAPLYVETGILEAGPEEGELIPGVLKAADLHSLAIDCLDSAAMKARFGAFRLQPGMRAVFEPIAGYLHVEDCIRHMASEGQSRGAELALDTVVTHWTYDSCEFLVHSDKESWRTKRLILTQGAWATDFLREQGVQLDVVRKMQLWFRASDNRFSSKQGFVPFAIETGEAEVFYGFPELDERGVKVAQHT